MFFRIVKSSQVSGHNKSSARASLTKLALSTLGVFLAVSASTSLAHADNSNTTSKPAPAASTQSVAPTSTAAATDYSKPQKVNGNVTIEMDDVLPYLPDPKVVKKDIKKLDEQKELVNYLKQDNYTISKIEKKAAVNAIYDKYILVSETNDVKPEQRLPFVITCTYEAETLNTRALIEVATNKPYSCVDTIYFTDVPTNSSSNLNYNVSKKGSNRCVYNVDSPFINAEIALVPHRHNSLTVAKDAIKNNLTKISKAVVETVKGTPDPSLGQVHHGPNRSIITRYPEQQIDTDVAMIDKNYVCPFRIYQAIDAQAAEKALKDLAKRQHEQEMLEQQQNKIFGKDSKGDKDNTPANSKSIPNDK